MLLNYIKIAFRNITKNKLHSIINILGLSIGIACSILAFIFVEDLISFDRHHTKLDRIYMIQSQLRVGDNENFAYGTPFPIGPALKDEFPAIEESVRIFRADLMYFYDSKREIISEFNFYYADPEIFNVFDHRFIYGTEKGALDSPDAIVLSETFSKKYFGDKNPVGEILSATSGKDYVVTGVFEDLPYTTYRRYDALFSMTGLKRIMNNWDIDTRAPGSFFISTGNNWTYLLLKPGAAISSIIDNYKSFKQKYYTEHAKQKNSDYTPIFQPLKDVYLYLKKDPNSTPEAITAIYILSALAGLILVIACINYMNLATGKAAGRAKEVGVRKVIGAGQASLMRQFLCESVLLTFVALLLGFVFVEILLPPFNDFLAKKMTFNIIENPGIFISILIVTFIVGILSGSYPAFVLSSFMPSRVLKGEVNYGKGKGRLRKTLVVIQFTISIIIIIFTLTIKGQIDFYQAMDLGFEKENILITLMAEHKSTEAFKREILKHNEIVSVATSNATAVAGGWQTYCDVETEDSSRVQKLYNFIVVDFDFLDLMEIKLLKGRSFNSEFKTDITDSVLVNETLAKEMGWKESVGKTIKAWGKDKKVIGVLKDFYFQTLKTKLAPMIVVPGNDVINSSRPIVSIKIRPENRQKALELLKENWLKFNPARPFEYNFLEEVLDYLYQPNRKLIKILYCSAGLSLLISCLGMFGLSSFIAERKTKEIGVRKVHGASVLNIFYHLFSEFIKLIIISGIIAWVITVPVMIMISENAPYRPKGFQWGFLIAIVVAAIFAFVTVSYHAIKASLNDPVEALRYE